MVREILKIRTDFGLGDNDPSFKDIELTDYSAKFPRMGMPSLSAKLMWPTPLDNEWTRKEYVVLRGERFYIAHTPSGKETNSAMLFQHDIEFTSEFAEILGNTYFVDAVPSYAATYDKPCTNNTKFTFYGTIAEFVDRINCALIYAHINDSALNERTYHNEKIRCLTTLDDVVGDGYCAMLDPYGDYDPSESYEFSFEDKSLWEAITEGFDVTKIPFERRGRKIVFGAVPNVVQHKFEYGPDNELLTVEHKNANAKVINRITMVGSSENIPYYYPNETEYGHIKIVADPKNKMLSANNVILGKRNTILSEVREGDYLRLRKTSDDSVSVSVDNTKFYTSFLHVENLELTYPGEVKPYPYSSQDNNENTWYVKASLSLTEPGYAKFTGLYGCIWSASQGKAAIENLVPSVNIVSLKKAKGKDDLIDRVTRNADGTYDIDYLVSGDYEITFAIGFKRYHQEDMFFLVKSVNIRADKRIEYYWETDKKKIGSLEKIGLSLNIPLSDEMIGDGFGWTAEGRMPFQDHLMPPRYRKTLGAERFYNAANKTYTDPDTGTKYTFPNPYIEGAPSEHIYRNEDIKPTIEGVTNADGELFGVIAGIAYDADDNDILKTDSTEANDKNNSLKYEHSFFYIKLNIFNGDYGFDLFAHASQTDPMTIQMRDGSCNGCKFKIQAAKFTNEAGYETYRNPIIVKDGVAVGVTSEDGIKESDLDPTQQNTQTHSIWICVQKDAETFGVIMPNQSNGFKPKIGDRFNIINIDLPEGYILAAEKRLEEEGIRFMADNNEEKFTFDIQASRIFLAENPDVLAELDENSVIKVRYNGRDYEQYVNQLSIESKDSEALPNVGIELTDELSVGESFIDKVAERAASLVANTISFGGGAGGGMNTALSEMRYLNKQKNDRTPYRLNVGDVFTAESGARFGDFVQGQFTGQGAAIDGNGNAEVESITIRSYMKVMELIYNRINAQEGDTSFSDSGMVECVLTQPDGSRIVQLRRRWEGDFTSFQPGDIVYGYVNDLDKADKKEYYKAWAWIKSVDRANNQLTIAVYPDEEVPSGKNFPLEESMMIARWGNNIEPSMETYINPEYSAVIGKRSDGTYYNKRQRTFFISTEGGNIVELMGVNKPILEKGNYGTILGVIPDGLLDPKTEELINKDQPYLFARGIIVQDLIRIGYEGLATRTANYRGTWDSLTASSPTEYYRSTAEIYDTVTHDGALWQCVVSGSTDEPGDLSPAWVKMTSSYNDTVIKLWTVNPSATVISVRKDEVNPATLSATVTLNSNKKAAVFTSNLDLHDEGVELYYSVGGETWQVFIIGNAESLDLENDNGYIELEKSVDDSDCLIVGGDNIDTKDIGDRIYFELRSVEDGTVLSQAQVPVVKDGERGAFQSTAFIRTNTEPGTPTGGTYDSPIPTSLPEWHDSIPGGEEILWASTRVFDNRHDTEWEKPRQMTDTASYDVEFSNVDEDPGTPDDNPTAWYDPDKDKDNVDFTQMLWRAERRKKNGVWSGWTVVRIKGESGDWTSYVFKKSSEQPETPVGTSAIPEGWSDAPSSEGIWWMSKATVNGGTGLAGEWSEPVKVTGEDGVDGKDGGYTDFKYSKNTSMTEYPPITRTDRNPAGWSDNPPSLEKDEYLWLSSAEINADGSMKTRWSIPVRISGGNGSNGDWTTYVFKKSDAKPSAPTGVSVIPDGWSDSPDSDGKWWMSKSIVNGNSGEAGEWSDPVQVTAEDGKPGRYTDFKYRVYADNVYPETIDNTARHPSGWSDTPPSVTDGFALWMIQAEINYNDTLVGTWSKPVRISGETGSDGGQINIWTINPNANIVSVRKGEVIPEVLSATVTLNNSLGSPVVFTSNLDLYDAGAQLLYSVDGVAWQTFIIGVQSPLDLEDDSGVIEMEDDTDGSKILTVGGDDIDTDTIGDRIYFELRSVADGTQLANIQVPVVKDGTDGTPGRDGLMVYPAGYYDFNTTYESTDETMPVVMYGEEGEENYFRLKKNATYRGADMPTDRNTPAKDVAKNDSETVWVLFDKFDSVFANIIMANFAKLSEAVFYGEWMISQKGVRNGTESDEYQYFKDGSFEPNYAVNFKTGEVKAFTGVFKGRMEANSGKFSNVEIEKDCTFAGVTVKKPTIITPTNIENFLSPVPSNPNQIQLMLDKAGMLVEFHNFTTHVSPSLILWSDRKYVGNTILIYNCNEPATNASVGFLGKNIYDSETDLTSHQPIIYPGKMAVFTCRVRIIDGNEQIYWEYRTGNTTSTTAEA